MTPDQRNGYPSQPDPDAISRRRFIRGVGWVLGAMATTAGVYEFVTQVVPALGNALGNIQIPTSAPETQNVPEVTTPDPEWYKHPTIIGDLKADNGTFSAYTPANRIGWFEITDPYGGLFLNIQLTTATENIVSNWDINNGFSGVYVELYSSIGREIDSWHQLLLYKKSALEQKYGKNHIVDIYVNSPNPNADGDIYHYNYWDGQSIKDIS